MMTIASWTALFYAAYCGLLFFVQRQILFPRDMVMGPPPVTAGIPNQERLWIETPAGKVEAWFLPPAPGTAAGPAPAVIFAHGNAELIDFWPDELGHFNRLGIGLLLVEYPGYGRSEGKPSQASIARTFTGAYDRLAARTDVDPTRIVLMGRSVGGGAVCQLAARRPAKAIILMSSFTSARTFAKRYLVPGFLMRDPFDNLTVIRDYTGPVLVIHGKTDELIPHAHGKKLAETALRGELITYPCGHNDCPHDWGLFWKDVSAFLRHADVISPPHPPRH